MLEDGMVLFLTNTFFVYVIFFSSTIFFWSNGMLEDGKSLLVTIILFFWSNGMLKLWNGSLSYQYFLCFVIVSPKFQFSIIPTYQYATPSILHYSKCQYANPFPILQITTLQLLPILHSSKSSYASPLPFFQLARTQISFHNSIIPTNPPRKSSSSERIFPRSVFQFDL